MEGKEKKRFKCMFCDVRSNSKLDLFGHITTAHEGKKPYKCGICGVSFTQQAHSRAHLIRHLASIHEEKKTFTYESGTRLSSKQNFIDHNAGKNEKFRKNKHEKTSNCTMPRKEENKLKPCRIILSRLPKSVLRIAKGIKEDTQPLEHFSNNADPGDTSDKKEEKVDIASLHEGKETYKCAICDYKFLTKHRLTIHITSVHEGKKPFNCSICDYNCSRKEHLKKHIESVHKGKKPFKCSICDNSSSQKSHF